MRRKPYSVVLFDEIEKAHPDIFNLLLQILEDGCLTDSAGRKVSFANTFIIMTTNAGVKELENRHTVGFGERAGEGVSQACMAELKKLLSPELLGRIDEIITFRPLDKTSLTQAAERELCLLQSRLLTIGCTMSYSAECPAAVADECMTGVSKRGSVQARDVRRIIRRSAENSISDMILQTGCREYALVCEDGRLKARAVQFSA